MADVLLSTDEVTVLGSPAKRDVTGTIPEEDGAIQNPAELTIGPPGNRGSKIFVGEGNPNLVDVGQEILPFDMYINLLSSDLEYLYLYQYFNSDGQLQWNRILRLIPNTFLSTQTKAFENGQALFFVPVVNVVPLSEVGNITEQNFNIQHNIINDKPIASSVTIGSLVVRDDQLVLPVAINAAEFDGTNWSYLSSSKIVQLVVTIA